MKEWSREKRYRSLQDPEEIRPLYEQVKASAYRQELHVQPVTGLLNDPNGFVFQDGTWHLFYQWCPWGAVHGLKYWYHVTSKDLAFWKNEGVCIKPGKEMDNYGAYSGSALPGKDALCLFYSGNHREPDWTRIPYTCMAKLYPDGQVKKLPWPLFGPHPDYTEHQRDPKIIYLPNKNRYFILLGAQNSAKRGCILVYESFNLSDGWEFAGELKVPGFEDFGSMWECPSIEHIGDKDVLIFCPQHIFLPRRGRTTNHSGYLLGQMDWDHLIFQPAGSFHVLDFGFDSYAAECASNLEDSSKAILTAWMGLPDGDYPTDDEGWQGCLTLPRELTVRGRRLIQRPLAALKNLRDGLLDISQGKLTAPCEMELFIGAAGGGESSGDFDLSLFTRPDGNGGLTIHYNDMYRLLSVDRSGMNIRFHEAQEEVREHLVDNPLTHLRIFIDHSSVEIFVNDGDAVFTSRVFPTEEETGFSMCGNANGRVWKLRPAVKDDFVV